MENPIRGRLKSKDSMRVEKELEYREAKLNGMVSVATKL